MLRQPRSAFTMIELLVVIAILGVLFAILLPAVQAARESANRAACKNNLVQQIVAVHHYEMVHEYYPPGAIDQMGPIVHAPSGHHHNWIIELLPYLQQRANYGQIDRSMSVYHSNNQAVRSISQPWLICPSGKTPGPGHPFSWYAAVHHDVEAPIDTNNNGVFFLNSKVTIDDVSDGTSHTLFIGEKQPSKGDLGWMSGTRATLRNAGAALAGSDQSDFPVGTFPQADAPVVATVGGFGSWHVYGVQFAMGDGSVRALNRYTAQAVLQQFAHRADGKLFDPSDSW